MILSNDARELIFNVVHGASDGGLFTANGKETNVVVATPWGLAAHMHDRCQLQRAAFNVLR